MLLCTNRQRLRLLRNLKQTSKQANGVMLQRRSLKFLSVTLVSSENRGSAATVKNTFSEKAATEVKKRSTAE